MRAYLFGSLWICKWIFFILLGYCMLVRVELTFSCFLAFLGHPVATRTMTRVTAHCRRRPAEKHCHRLCCPLGSMLKRTAASPMDVDARLWSNTLWPARLYGASADRWQLVTVRNIACRPLPSLPRSPPSRQLCGNVVVSVFSNGSVTIIITWSSTDGATICLVRIYLDTYKTCDHIQLNVLFSSRVRVSIGVRIRFSVSGW